MTARGRRALPLLFALALLLVAAAAVVKLTGLDVPWMTLVHAQAPGPWSSAFWSCATILGLGWTGLILVLACDRGQGRGTALLLPTFVLGALLVHVPKSIFASPRPAGTAILPHLHVIGDAFSGPVSMPSGHAVTAAATAMLLCALLPRSRAVPGSLGIVIAAGLVAWSRVVVGAHWPSDVLAGSGLGLFAAGVAVAASRAGRTKRVFERFAAAVHSRAGQRWVAALEIVAAIGILKERTGYPAGQPMVLLLALVAVLSAAWRLHASREHSADRATAEPT